MRSPTPGLSVRSFTILVSVSACAARLLAADGEQLGKQPPLHPTVIVAQFEGKPYPVTAVEKEVAEIVVDGKLKKLPALQSYGTPLAVSYAPGFVELKAESASSRSYSHSYHVRGDMKATGDELIPGERIDATGQYECTLVAAEAHDDCFLAVALCGIGMDGLPDTGQTAIAFGHVGTLAPGRETRVKINCAYITPKSGSYACYPLLFSRGLEIRTTRCDLAAYFFHLRDVRSHDSLIERYLRQNPAADKPAVAYLRFPPLLPVGQDPLELPQGIEARFDVTGYGRVESVNLTPGLDPKVAASIERALDGWMFLPRLKKGVPTRTTVRLPLSFGAGS